MNQQKVLQAIVNIWLMCLVLEAESLTKPSTSDKMQIVLGTSSIDTRITADVYDFDLFDVSDSTFHHLKSNGAKIICYFSAGTYENWRPDKHDFPSSVLGKSLGDWPGEKWLDIRSSAVRNIMKARLDKAKARGCDGVDPDNVDGYSNDNGFHLSASDQLSYDKFLANEAHHRGLSVGLKNNLGQARELVHYFDFAVNEQCVKYHECSLYQPFIDAGKAVMHIEYSDDSSNRHKTPQEICHSHGVPHGLTNIIKKRHLDNWIVMC